jgi:hypothetical protein
MVKATAHHSVYVILLNSSVFTEERKFREANPDFKSGLCCLYVGMTGLKLEERFENHKRGYKGNKYVKKYGERLALEFLERSNPMTYDEARAEEPRLADALRRLGYAVWQN